MSTSMKTLIAAGLMTVAGAATAAGVTSPLVGAWTLDVATLPMPPQVRPQRVSLEFRDVAPDRWATKVEIIDAAGQRLDSASTVVLDGSPGKATGSYFVDVVAARMPEPNVLVMQFIFEGIPRSTRVYSVSADGAVLTETETYFLKDGTPKMRVARFKRSAP
ncbi:hypothetical protein ACNI65_11700 [Roseateles sp. So40a]|uniref:hypothetical protein n=1 Tax=Roseateles sp. So40a TaxID=3400226 RepID=UPI003A84AEC5